jgi:hypothetical protein
MRSGLVFSRIHVQRKRRTEPLPIDVLDLVARDADQPRPQRRLALERREPFERGEKDVLHYVVDQIRVRQEPMAGIRVHGVDMGRDELCSCLPVFSEDGRNQFAFANPVRQRCDNVNGRYGPTVCPRIHTAIVANEGRFPLRVSRTSGVAENEDGMAEAGRSAVQPGPPADAARPIALTGRDARLCPSKSLSGWRFFGPRDGIRCRWRNEDIPGAELTPGKGKATPMAASTEERMIRLWAGPQGALKSALAGIQDPPLFAVRPGTQVPADVSTAGKTSAH